jgi:hypothetical protein
VKWDAYAGNIVGTRPVEVAEMLAFGVHGRSERGRPRGRYHDVFEVKDAGASVGWVAHDAQLDTAYFEVKGARTPDAVATIRRHWADAHRVSRMDACEDYSEPGAFESLVALLDRHKDPRVKSDEIRPRDGDRGRTIYYGSPTSRVYVRCYEAGKMKERLHFNRPDWARAEAQVRPGKSVEKAIAARCSPLEAWGFGAWTQRAAEELARVEVARIERLDEPPTFERTTLYVARTFRRHFEAMLEDFGSWRCIGSELEAVWKADDESMGPPKGTKGGAATDA